MTMYVNVKLGVDARDAEKAAILEKNVGLAQKVWLWNGKTHAVYGSYNV